MPKPLRFAVVLWWVVALLLLLEIAAMWFDRGGLVEQLMRAEGLPAADAARRASRLLVSQTAFGLVLAAGYLVLGAFVQRRRAWARIALTGFAVVHLVMLLGTGAVLGPQAVLLVLGVVAAVLMWRGTSGEWLTGER
ncbi:hypothetical protein [Saccharopolyspora griseoalba]|uniref:Integral membrane protein n=1 Tax=Saccharopolyspora griseoalba TaxID=1431848 RepID=A0ABW2LGI6_9PSEU